MLIALNTDNNKINSVRSLRDSLRLRRVEDLRKIAANVSVRLTSSVRKNDIIERLIDMAKIGVAHKPVDDDHGDSEAISSISYLPDNVKGLNSLPVFSSVKQWGKQLSCVLRDFTL